MSSGDFNCEIKQSFNGPLEKLRLDLNETIKTISQTFTKILTTTNNLGTGIHEIASASNDLSTRTEHQATALEGTAAELKNITKTVQVSSDGAESTIKMVENARDTAAKSEVVVRSALSAMEEIESSAKEITEIISIIDEIAFQTNLLALNAGVEAARAGDAGQGFAVVASEVRALAQRSAVAAKEIKGLISKSTEQVKNGSTLVGKTGEALETISKQVIEISITVKAIVGSSKDQFQSLNSLNTAVSEMDTGTQQNAAVAEEATAACHCKRRSNSRPQ